MGSRHLSGLVYYSNQCSTASPTKAVVCTVLSVGDSGVTIGGLGRSMAPPNPQCAPHIVHNKCDGKQSLRSHPLDPQAKVWPPLNKDSVTPLVGDCI